MTLIYFATEESFKRSRRSESMTFRTYNTSDWVGPVPGSYTYIPLTHNLLGPEGPCGITPSGKPRVGGWYTHTTIYALKLKHILRIMFRETRKFQCIVGRFNLFIGGGRILQNGRQQSAGRKKKKFKKKPRYYLLNIMKTRENSLSAQCKYLIKKTLRFHIAITGFCQYCLFFAERYNRIVSIAKSTIFVSLFHPVFLFSL